MLRFLPWRFRGSKWPKSIGGALCGALYCHSFRSVCEYPRTVMLRYAILAYKKVRRIFLRLRPQKVKDLAFAGHELPKSVSKLMDYSDALVIESNGVIPGRPVSHAFDKREIYEIFNPRIDPSMGEVYLESGEFVIQSTPWHTYIPYPERRPLGKAQRLTDENGFIRLPAWTYYHQVIENLPPYLFLKSNQPLAQTLIPEQNSSLIREILDSLGFSYVTHERQVEVNRLFMVSHGRDSGYPHPKDIEILRSFFTPGSPFPASEKIIYVSRLKSSRSFPDEKLLVRQLSSHPKVEIVEAETLSFEQQRQLFSGARALIGVHGAGMTNQVWMPRGSSVFEIIDPAYSNAVYESLAKILGHTYSNIRVSNTDDFLRTALSQVSDFLTSLN